LRHWIKTLMGSF